jgi:predicted permease
MADARHALRVLRRGPVVAAAAVLTLALGIGASTAIFSVVNAVILRPLPFPHADRLMMLSEDNAEKNWHQNVVAPANYLDWRERVTAFEDAAGYVNSSGQATLTGDGPPRLLTLGVVTGNFFSVLGVHPARGRLFRDDETWKNGTHIALISDQVWRNQYGGDSAIIGRTIHLDGVARQVVGVVPGISGLTRSDVEVWTPMEWDPADRAQVWFRRAHWIRAIARLRPAVAVAQADAEFQTVVHQIQREFPLTNKVMGADMIPLHDFLIGNVRRPLLVLLAAVTLLLLISCANVGNLLLVQALGREREAALRLTLGAGRSRLVRQALTESLVLSVLGGLAGLALGWAGTRALAALQPAGMLPIRDIGVNWGVLGFVAAVSAASGLLFGVAPALWAGRRVPAEILKQGDRGGSEGHRMRRWGNALVVGEMSLALLLTLGAGLLVRSFWRLEHVDPGFDPHGVLTVAFDLPPTRYDSASRVIAFYEAWQRRVRELPGVDAAALVIVPPLSGTGWTSDFHIEGHAHDDYGSEVGHRPASPEYFSLMRVPLKSGRLFTPADRAGAPHALVINEALARQYFQGVDPVGQRIAFDKFPDSASVWWTIVGVVGSEHQNSLGVQPQVEVFEPFAQQANSYMTLVVRTRSSPGALGPSIRRALADQDPNLAIASMTTVDDIRARSLAGQRFIMSMLMVFGGVGLSLAVIGVYGVMAQLARRRGREMGIRMALGAQASQVQWLVVRHGMTLVGASVALGITGALAATRSMRALLFEVAPSDPLTFIAVPCVLAATAFVATWIPARRASRSDPAHALRSD